MTTVGITAEFDPFHNGHQYLIDSVRAELAPDAVVCVMSGNFTQRGMPAVFDKFVRAEMAVRCGVDLVVELPAAYAVNGAEMFAKGAVRILKGLGVTHLAFGSESGRAEVLDHIAKVSVSEDAVFEESFRERMDAGETYAASYAHALSRSVTEGLLRERSQGSSPSAPDGAQLGAEAFWNAAAIRTILKSPNDILGLAYLRQNHKQGADLKAFAVKRVGSAHGSRVLGEGILSSAAGIRAALFGGRDGMHPVDNKDVLVYLPDEIHELFEDAPRLGKNGLDRYDDLVRYALLSRSAEEIAAIAEAGEGLENVLKKAVQKADALDSLILAAKSKRYTYARISRCLAQLVLGITKTALRDADRQELAYARVLAFSERGASLLRSLRRRRQEAESSQAPARTIPVYTNLSKNVPPAAPERLLLDIDVRASDIWSLLQGRGVYEGSDYVRKPFNQQ